MLALRSIAAPVQRQCWRAAPRAAVTLSVQVRRQLRLLRIDDNWG
jgi:isocitrate dehydrogenase (NAD+)